MMLEDWAVPVGGNPCNAPGALPLGCPPAVELPATVMDKDALSKSIWGKEFEAFDADSSWLDRLDMGLDFSDLLGDVAPDSAADGLVPSLSGGGGGAAVPTIDSEDDLQVPSLGSLPASPAGFDLYSAFYTAAAADPMAGFEAELGKLPEGLLMPTPGSAGAQQVAEAAALCQPQVPAQVVPQAVLPAPYELAAVEASHPMFAASEESAAAAAVSAEQQQGVVFMQTRAQAAQAAADGEGVFDGRFELTIPNSEHLTREERVQRYREKRKRRQFNKVIRYASRKAYAEVRPRIKGRFAKREEVQAWKAAEAAMRSGGAAAVALGADMAMPVM